MIVSKIQVFFWFFYLLPLFPYLVTSSDISLVALELCGELGPAVGCMGASHKVKFITFFVSSNVIDFLGPLVACVDCACFGLEIMIFHF